MPELPEVETIKRDLSIKILNQTLKSLSVKDKSYLKRGDLSEDLLKNLQGKKILSMERKGKYLLFIFEKTALIFHLGLTGALVLNPTSLPENLKKHEILTMHFESDHLHYFDIRRFGKIYLVDHKNLSKFFTSLGKDALEISFEEFRDLIKSHNLKLKSLLLNQSLISGLGNIYTDELLFRAKIHPERPSRSLSEEEIKRLYQMMKALLEEAISLRGSSVKNYVDGEGKKGSFQERHLVYGKRGEPCPRCSAPLEYKKIAQRGTTFCPRCQK